MPTTGDRSSITMQGIVTASLVREIIHSHKSTTASVGLRARSRSIYMKRTIPARLKTCASSCPLLFMGRERDEYTLVEFQSYIHFVDFANPSPLYGSLILSSALNQNFPYKPRQLFLLFLCPFWRRASGDKSLLKEKQRKSRVEPFILCYQNCYTIGIVK